MKIAIIPSPAFTFLSNICNTSYIDNTNYIDNHNNLDHPYTVGVNQFIHRHYVNGFYRSKNNIKVNVISFIMELSKK